MGRFSTIHCVVLKWFDFREADRVLTVFSKERGKVSVLAKGIRRVVSKKAGVVDVGNHALLHIFSGTRFFILREAQLVHAYSAIKSELRTLKYAFYILELIDMLLPEEQPHEDVYRLVLETFALLETSPRKIFIRAFEIKLLAKLGYLHVRADDLHARFVSGAEYLLDCDFTLLEFMQYAPWSRIFSLTCDSACLERLSLFLQHRLQLVSARSIHSLTVFD